MARETEAQWRERMRKQVSPTNTVAPVTGGYPTASPASVQPPKVSPSLYEPGQGMKPSAPAPRLMEPATAPAAAPTYPAAVKPKADIDPNTPRATAAGVKGWTARRRADGTMEDNTYVPPSAANATKPIYEDAPITADQVAKNRGVLKRLSKQWQGEADASMEMTSDAAAKMKGVFAANSLEQSSRNLGGRSMNRVDRAQARARWDQAADDAYLAALPEKKRREVEAQRAATAMQRVKGTEGYQTEKLRADAQVKAGQVVTGREDQRESRREQLEREKMALMSQDRAADRAAGKKTNEDRFYDAYNAFMAKNPDIDDKAHDDFVARARKTYNMDGVQEPQPQPQNPNPTGNKVSPANVKPGALQEKAKASGGADPAAIQQSIANIEAAIRRTTNQSEIARANTRIAQLRQQLNNG